MNLLKQMPLQWYINDSDVIYVSIIEGTILAIFATRNVFTWSNGTSMMYAWFVTNRDTMNEGTILAIWNEFT